MRSGAGGSINETALKNVANGSVEPESPLISKYNPTVLEVSPGQALRSGFFWSRYISTLVIVLGMNAGMGYMWQSERTATGVWVLPNIPNQADGFVWTDVMAVTLIMATLMNTAMSWGLRNQIKLGNYPPINPDDLSRGPFRFLPVRVSSVCARSLLFALEYIFLWGVPTLVTVYFLCKYETWMFSSPGPECPAGDIKCCKIPNNPQYIWIKAGWAVSLAMFLFPGLFLANMNRALLKPEIYDAFLRTRGLDAATLLFNSPGMPPSSSMQRFEKLPDDSDAETEEGGV